MFQPEESLTFTNATASLEAGVQAIVSGQAEIDLAALRTVDSSAVSVMLAWHRAALHQGTALHFQHIPDNLQNLIGLYGVDALLAG